MKILFIGNSFLYWSCKYLPLILNRLNIRNVEITLIYISSGRACTFNNYFSHTLADREIIHQPNVKYPQVIYKYMGEGDRYIFDKLPDISIEDVIKSQTWDKIVICTHLGESTSWRYNELYKQFKPYVDKIRAISDAKIYYKDMTLTRKGKFKIDNITNLYAYDGPKSLFKNKEEQKRLFESIDSRLCKELNLIRIPMCFYYEEFKKHINNKYDLLMDKTHPDCGIGSYFQCCVIYHFLIEPFTGIKLPSSGIKIDVSNKFYQSINDMEETKDRCINVDDKIMKICNNVIIQPYINKNPKDDIRISEDIAAGEIIKVPTIYGYIWKKKK